MRAAGTAADMAAIAMQRAGGLAARAQRRARAVSPIAPSTRREAMMGRSCRTKRRNHSSFRPRWPSPAAAPPAPAAARRSSVLWRECMMLTVASLAQDGTPSPPQLRVTRWEVNGSHGRQRGYAERVHACRMRPQSREATIGTVLAERQNCKKQGEQNWERMGKCTMHAHQMQCRSVGEAHERVVCWRVGVRAPA